MVTIALWQAQGGSRSVETALLHDFKSPVGTYTGRGHLVIPPAGCEYTACAAGVRHVCGAGLAATYCLRSDGLIDRITTASGGTQGGAGVAPLRRSSASRSTAGRPDVQYTAVVPGYYVSHLVRADGAIDVLAETNVKGLGITNEEQSEGGRLECTIAAPAGTRYVGGCSRSPS